MGKGGIQSSADTTCFSHTSSRYFTTRRSIESVTSLYTPAMPSSS